MNVLVTGGAGYIGSHMAKALSRAGHAVTVVDNLSTGHRDAARFGRFVEGDLRDGNALEKLFCDTAFDAVMHFAACCYVGESVEQPAKYYENNVVGTLNLLAAMRAAGVDRLVFSSSCATYGDPVRLPMDELHPQNPVNPYGMTKFAVERAMADFGRAYGLRTVALRYFNAAGSDPEGELGERHEPETHLIPLVLREALRVRAGGRPEGTELRVNGEGFETADGTCVRDYVHISDLCAAHLLALHRLLEGGDAAFEAFNLGNGTGFSVKEVIGVCREVTGADIRYSVGPRRPGDPPALVADARKAREVLEWKPRFERLHDIVRTAWDWMRAQAGA
ncbi:MAG TPA: UDP-glucose 4-epimerase GalE [Burkholderiales bacterium]|nr:UDP-glucose 4-epimerase GalE [Burkholderiales bacterium]